MFGGSVLRTAYPLLLGFRQGEPLPQRFPQSNGKVGHLGDGPGIPAVDPLGQLVGSVGWLLLLPQEIAHRCP